jgi:hypothetical protein
MYAVKVEFDTPTSMNSMSRVVPIKTVMEAAVWFNYLTLAHHFTKPVPVKGGGTIDVLDAWIYEVEVDDLSKVKAAVEEGKAILIDKIYELDVAINNETPEIRAMFARNE